MGWTQGSYRDEYWITHDGNVIGHSACVSLFPTRNLGITILTNMNGVSLASYLITFFAADLVLGYEPWLSASDVCEFPCQFVHCPEEEKVTLTLSLTRNRKMTDTRNM